MQKENVEERASSIPSNSSMANCETPPILRSGKNIGIAIAQNSEASTLQSGRKLFKVDSTRKIKKSAFQSPLAPVVDHGSVNNGNTRKKKKCAFQSPLAPVVDHGSVNNGNDTIKHLAFSTPTKEPFLVINANGTVLSYAGRTPIDPYKYAALNVAPQANTQIQSDAEKQVDDEEDGDMTTSATSYNPTESLVTEFKSYIQSAPTNGSFALSMEHFVTTFFHIQKEKAKDDE